ncbi:MAG: AAA family ATPase [Bacillota bacterium]|nr:AAA family ATPase [Bacillota bacterium]
MRYIASLELENFQCHARTLLTFSPGLNVIVGPSDQGKTAIIRGLRWVLYNEPRGSDFVRVGAESCRVTVTFDDGTRISREKGPRTNRYLIEKDGERREFNSVNATVESEVCAAHGMAPLALDEDRELRLNLGGQLEAPFLLEEPGALRAKAVSQIVGVHIIDAAIRDVLADEGRAAREEADLGRDIAVWEEKLARYDDLPAHEQALQQAEAVLARARGQRERAERLFDLKKSWERAREDAERLSRLVHLLGGLPQAEDLAGRAGALVDRYGRLRQLSLRWRESGSRKAHWERVAAGLAGAPRAEGLLERAAELQSRWQRLREVRSRLAQVRERIGKAVAGRDRARYQEREVGTRYGELLVRLGRCPTCGAAIKPDQVPAILAEICGGGR